MSIKLIAMGILTARTGLPALLAGISVVAAAFLIVMSLVLVRDVATITMGKGDLRAGESSPAPEARKKTIQEYAAAFRQNPFSGRPAEIRPLGAGTGSQPGPAADLTLVGTIVGGPRGGFAIFSDSGGQQEIYRVGDRIPGAGILRSVDRDAVKVADNGRAVTVPLADIVRITEVGPAYPPLSRSSSFIRPLGDGTYLLDQRKVQQAIDNPNQLMTDARLQPNHVDGRQEGFTLREVRSGGIYNSLGLQNGDVLLRINEYNISNPEAALQAFTALKGMDRVQLDILRQGSRMTLTYTIR